MKRENCEVGDKIISDDGKIGTITSIGSGGIYISENDDGKPTNFFKFNQVKRHNPFKVTKDGYI